MCGDEAIEGVVRIVYDLRGHAVGILIGHLSQPVAEIVTVVGLGAVGDCDLPGEVAVGVEAVGLLADGLLA